MSTFKTIALLSGKTSKAGKQYYSYANAKADGVDAKGVAKIKFDWSSTIMAFPTKNGKGICIVQKIEE